MLYLSIIVPALIGASPQNSTEAVMWATSPAIARIEARRHNTPILVVVQSGRGPRYAQSLQSPEVAPLLRNFEVVELRDPSTYTQVVTGSPPSQSSHIAITQPDGKVVARFVASFRIEEIRDAIASVQPYFEGKRLSLVGQVRIAASTGKDREVTRLLRQADTKKSLLASEAYGAFGDELRVRGDFPGALRQFEAAMNRSQNPESKVRWGVRASMIQARSGQFEEGLARLRNLTKLPGLSVEQRGMVEMTIQRMLYFPR